MATTKRERGNPIGASARAVAHNVKKFRRRQGMTLEDLSKALEDAGQPISNSALSKLERGVRRVDVDDLTALAATLGVSPNDLLAPPASDEPSLTGVPDGISLEEVHKWLDGDVTLSYEALANDLIETVRKYAFQIAHLNRSIEKGAGSLDEHSFRSDPVERKAQLLISQKEAWDRAVFLLAKAGELPPGHDHDALPEDLTSEHYSNLLDRASTRTKRTLPHTWRTP